MAHLLPMPILQSFADVLSEPFLLAMFGAALILAGSFVRWKGRRNSTKIRRGAHSSERTITATVPKVRWEANSSVAPPDWDQHFDSRTAESTFAAQTLHPAKPVADSNSISQ